MVFCPLALVVSPLGTLALSVIFIVAAILVGLLPAAGQPGEHRFVGAIAAATAEFGNTAGRIGFPIALAAVIGISLMESGAADKIVRRMIAAFGEGRSALALAFSGF